MRFRFESGKVVDASAERGEEFLIEMLDTDDGARRLGELGHSFDAFCFHHQLPELVALARACPEVVIVTNHLGVPIAGGPYRGRADEVRRTWQAHLSENKAAPPPPLPEQ